MCVVFHILHEILYKYDITNMILDSTQDGGKQKFDLMGYLHFSVEEYWMEGPF